MKLSIVTISFNQVSFLKSCIDSVLSQSLEGVELEYILVDPGSSDGSRELISSYGKKVICHFERDNGPADGLNKGFSLATGDLYCYLNSDDILLPGAISTVIKYFRRNPNVDVIYGNGIVIDGMSKFRRRVYSDEFSPEAYAHGAGVVIQPSTFFRAGAFNATSGFNVNNRSNWDGELFLDMWSSGVKCVRLNADLSAYRIHDEGITGSGRLAALHKKHNENMFEKVYGRPRNKLDIVITTYYRIKKHLMNPLALKERIVAGPIFGAGK